MQTTPTDPERPRYWLNGVIAAALISAGILVGWLQPWQNEQTVPAAESVALTPGASGSADDVPVPSYDSAELSDRPQQESLRQPPTAAVAAENPPTRVTLTQQEPDFDDDSSASPQPAAGIRSASRGQLPQESIPPGTATAEGKKVMALTDLPPSVRREIPDIAIMFHAYSADPAERRVMINGNMTQEGEALADGLGLQQITRDGVILVYKGYRFHHGVR
ncbi:MAG: general secretion pathway protein GspB [Thiobacillaceae bacterium]|nr:general secretion pathway protein GspB [Thiobacillaceae bacterium]